MTAVGSLPVAPAAPAPHFGRVTKAGFQDLIDHFALSRIFEPWKGGGVDDIQSADIRAKVREVTLTTSDGIKLDAWHIPAQPGKQTIVYAHGNTGNKARDFRQRTMERFVREGFGYLTFDFRGYGKSEGSPSEQGLYEDYRTAVQYLKDKHHLQPERDLIALGESLGGAVVVDAAASMPFRAAMVFSTFTTMGEMIDRIKNQYHVPGFIRVGENIHKQFRSIDKIASIRSPLLIAHGAKDTFIPPEMAKALYLVATGSVYKAPLHLVKGGEHNDLFDLGGPALIGALNRLLADTQYMVAPPPPTDGGHKRRSWFTLPIGHTTENPAPANEEGPESKQSA